MCHAVITESYAHNTFTPTQSLDNDVKPKTLAHADVDKLPKVRLESNHVQKYVQSGSVVVGLVMTIYVHQTMVSCSGFRMNINSGDNQNQRFTYRPHFFIGYVFIVTRHGYWQVCIHGYA